MRVGEAGILEECSWGRFVEGEEGHAHLAVAFVQNCYPRLSGWARGWEYPFGSIALTHWLSEVQLM